MDEFEDIDDSIDDPRDDGLNEEADMSDLHFYRYALSRSRDEDY